MNISTTLELIQLSFSAPLLLVAGVLTTIGVGFMIVCTRLRVLLVLCFGLFFLASLAGCQTPPPVKVKIEALDVGKLAERCPALLLLTPKDTASEESFLDWYTLNHLRNAKCSADKDALVDALRSAGYIR